MKLGKHRKGWYPCGCWWCRSLGKWEGGCGTLEGFQSTTSILPSRAQALSLASALPISLNPLCLVPVSWQCSWQELIGTVPKRHLWAEQMRTEGPDLDMVPCCTRAESEGNPCPSQSQDVVEASCLNTLGPSGLQTVLEIFTNTKFTCYFTGKADPWAIFPLAVLVCFSSGPSALTIIAMCPWAYEAKLMILLNIQTLTHT